MRCEQCKKRFSPKVKGQRFCSCRCVGVWTAKQRGQVGKITYACRECGKRFVQYAGNKRVFCSKVCETQSHRKDRPKCEGCGKPVRLMRNRYCSKHCSNAARPLPGITSWMGFYQRAQRANPTPMPCILCAALGKHRHHTDYGKPEIIIWLCTGCHAKQHPNKRNRNRARPLVPPVLL